MTELLTVNVCCISCEKMSPVTVPKKGYIAGQEGALIQTALPDLTPEERELLISNTCGTCFDHLTKEI